MAKLNNFQQRQYVKLKSRQLKDIKYYSNEQFPPDINEQRRLLINNANKKSDKDATQLVYNKLYVDDSPIQTTYLPKGTWKTQIENSGNKTILAYRRLERQ
jgi:hypothetical protein